MQPTYATLPDRVKAAVIDGFLLIGAMYGISEILASFNNVPNYVRIILAVLIFLIYDPFFTSFYGGTIGHSYSNIEVKKLSDYNDKISFPIALIRFLAKAGLGWLSLLTVVGNEKKMAIHDYLAQSVVLLKEGEQ